MEFVIQEAIVIYGEKAARFRVEIQFLRGEDDHLPEWVNDSGKRTLDSLAYIVESLLETYLRGHGIRGISVEVLPP